MSYRDPGKTVGDRIADIERRLRSIEQPGSLPPDPGWILVELDGELRYVYVPSGATGPIVGIKSGTLESTDVAGGDLTGTYPNPQIAPGVIVDADVNPLNIDGEPNIPSMRTLGTGANQAAAGNDPRFDQIGSGGPPTGPAGGDLIGTYPNPTIDANAVSFAKMQDIASDRLIGRDTPGAGNPEELTVSGGVEFTGAGGIQTGAFTGDVTKPAGGTAQTIANDAVTFAKMQNLNPSVVVGRGSLGGVGDPEEITLGAGLSMTGTTLDVSAAASDGGFPFYEFIMIGT